MRTVPASIAAAWAEGLFIGDRRPIARVTVQHPSMRLRNYPLVSTFTEKITTDIKSGDVKVTIDPKHGQKVNQTYADYLFTGGTTDHPVPSLTALFVALYDSIDAATPETLAASSRVSPALVTRTLAGYLPSLAALLRMVGALGGDAALQKEFRRLYALRRGLELPLELPNVKSVSWSRSVDSDVADCTIEVWNTRPLAIGETPDPDDLDQPGYYTYSRGGSSFSSAWGHARNPWFGMLVPDNIVRTFEGYGFDPDVPPELDPNLVQTGIWMIDSVTMTTAGTMSIKMRDLGRLLLDQMYYAPVVPADFYNEDWTNWDGEFPTKPAQTKLKVTAQDSSNTPWIGSGTVAGHKLSWAFDGNPNTYWLSIGNDRPSRRFAYEWVQCKVNNQSVNRVKLRTKKKGYTYYVSVKVGGVWQGAKSINYHEDGIGMNGSDIAYVATGAVTTEKFIDVKLPATYKKVQAIRVTLGNLQSFPVGTYHYRGAIRDVEVYGPGGTGKPDHYVKGPAGSNPGRYDDYTDIVKLICAWAGFLWPAGGRQRITDGTYRSCSPTRFDSAVLGKGVKAQVWGYFQPSGTTGTATLSRSEFDKKPLMDGIAYVRGILGFVFFIDEYGGVQWRMPNVYNYGCLRSNVSANPKYLPGRVHLISEDSVLMSLDCTIDSKNVRESYFVGDAMGKFGAFAPGFNPNPTGIRRMAGWTDPNFSPATDSKGNSTKKQVADAEAQCQLMADMLSLRQLFTYRKDRVQIPANPAIQIDDQIKIVERVSEEAYVHYVNGISSSLDMSSGEWTYDLDTHWLGETPNTRWLFKTEDLYPVSQKYVAAQQEATASSVVIDGRGLGPEVTA